MTTEMDHPDAFSPEDVHQQCPKCRYLLTGLTEPRCPECGMKFAWSHCDQCGATVAGVDGARCVQCGEALPEWQASNPEWISFLLVLMVICALVVVCVGIPAIFVAMSPGADRGDFLMLTGRGLANFALYFVQFPATVVGVLSGVACLKHRSSKFLLGAIFVMVILDLVTLFAVGR